MIHYGSILEKAVRSSNISITELAKRLHVNRRSVYYWFEKKRLDEKILKEIGVIINHDFSSSLPPAFNDRIPIYTSKSPAPANEDVDFWKDKYNQLLEQYNTTLHKLREPIY